MLNTHFWKKYFIVYDYLNELIPYKELILKIVQHMNVTQGDVILDIGSGTGNIAMILKDKVTKIIGIDMSNEGASIHRKKIPNAEIIVMDISLEKLPFSDNVFDKVYSNNTLYTIPKERRVFIAKEMFRVLKPGGIIVISNLRKGFNPVKIYTIHIKQSVQKLGVLKTFFNSMRLIVPTMKIFYYNHLIQKENKKGFYDFFNNNEQKDLLESVGFVDVSNDNIVYAEQAIMNYGTKK